MFSNDSGVGTRRYMITETLDTTKRIKLEDSLDKLLQAKQLTDSIFGQIMP
jgi:hypothetical protein